jgi:hypothetical protein
MLEEGSPMPVAQALDGQQTMPTIADIQADARQLALEALQTPAGRRLAEYLGGLDETRRADLRGRVLVFDLTSGELLEKLPTSAEIEDVSARYQSQGVIAGFYRVT